MRFILHWLLVALVFYALPYLPIVGNYISVDNFKTAIYAAIIFGLINAIIKPVLKIITLPLTIITFGLFAIVLNIVLFWVVAYIVPGFDIPTLAGAILGSVTLTIAGWVIEKVLR